MFGRYAEMKENNIRLHARINEQKDHIAHLEAELEMAQHDAERAREDARAIRRDSLARAQITSEQNVTIARQMQQIIDMRSELGALREILADLTGKDVNELIEAHRRAVRMLAYEEVEVKNGVPENSEG